MTFGTIVFRGLVRRPVRTGLTVLGIALGIGAVVALVGLAAGYEKGIGGQIDAIGVDIIVSNMEGGLMPKAFDDTVPDEIAAMPGVAEVTSVLMQILSVEDAPMLMVYGREWGGFTWHNLSLVDGRFPLDESEPAVVLGTLAAGILRKKPGDPIQIEGMDFTVTGIVDGKSAIENGSVIMSLPRFQEATGYEGKVNFVDVRVPAGSPPEVVGALCEAIEARYPKLRAVRAAEVVGTSQGFRLAKAMSWSTSLLAIAVGIFGVMNTMLMAVFERTHEIGILLALGWRRRRIVGLILCESAVLGLLGGVVGIGLGAGALAIIGATPSVRGLLVPDLSLPLAAGALAMALAVGILSGLYPAWRSSRLSPGTALQGG